MNYVRCLKTGFIAHDLMENRWLYGDAYCQSPEFMTVGVRYDTPLILNIAMISDEPQGVTKHMTLHRVDLQLGQPIDQMPFVHAPDKKIVIVSSNWDWHGYPGVLV